MMSTQVEAKPGLTMETTVYGKWILAGEHAVLRGAPAVVFPAFSRKLDLRYESNEADLTVDFTGPHGDELKLLFWGVIERALEITSRTRRDASGHFDISSSIPVGAGLGASAALCVGLGRWFQWKGWVSDADLPEFCRQLENLFHGESSGVDIAVALSGRGLHFERSGKRISFDHRWEPNWYLSYSGKRGVTSECVARVKALWEKNPELGAAIDADMKEASLRAERALQAPSSQEGFEELASAIHLAKSCFERWGLAGGEIGSHLQMLVDHGAYAVKPTGSGDGGFVLSLWRQPPPEELLPQLIPLAPGLWR